MHQRIAMYLATALVTLTVMVALTTVAPRIKAADSVPCRQDAMIVFDSSGSMSGMIITGVRQSRIDRVREALNEVLPQIERDRNIGLIIYGPGNSTGDTASCRNIDTRFGPIPNAASRIIADVGALEPWGETPLTSAVEMAADVLSQRVSEGVIVLFTDGQETCGGQTCALARRLRNQGNNITVHVVDYTVQNPYGNQSNFKSHCLANETGGVYVPAQTKSELVAAFRKTLGCPMLAHNSIATTPSALRRELKKR